MSGEQPHILFIDSYDSFTHNLTALCRESLPGSLIHVIKNDQLTIQDLIQHLKFFTAIVVGPGPGSPLNENDIGVVKDIWHASDSHLLPIFGVCLGLQSLAVEYGATLRRLKVVKHGQISPIEHTDSNLFQGVGNVKAVRYHSLHVEVPEGSDMDILAWADDGKHENGKVVMAVKHRSKPFWAVQYHPESVRTSGGGVDIMHNFWNMARYWNTSHGRFPQRWDPKLEQIFGAPWPAFCAPSRSLKYVLSPRQVITKVSVLPQLTSNDVAEIFGASKESRTFVMLDSASSPGQYSIIASLNPASIRLEYRLGDNFVTFIENEQKKHVLLEDQDIWSWTSSFMDQRRAVGGRQDIPFWGGLVGYLSYELGCSSLVGRQSDTRQNTPDLNLVFVERSVVVDKETNSVYVQSIAPDDHLWVDDTASSLMSLSSFKVQSDDYPKNDTYSKAPRKPSKVIIPDHQRYLSRIRSAKEHLAAGNSYELCLTAQTQIIVPKSRTSSSHDTSSSWALFKKLQRKNPAPHSGYLRLHPTTVLSSSPERFLSYSRPPHQVYQLRPIKGTLRKTPSTTRQDAELALRGSTKEVAENLMIVDLIRHDLHGVVGENVEVKKFCGIEEYETVWQMVSVVQGKVPPTTQIIAPTENQFPPTMIAADTCDKGWDVLRQCLPPGSMTGAPKKRSVEILRDLEDGPRRIYSGVLGYWDAGGGGDWAVVIRTCFKMDAGDDKSDSNQNANEVVANGDSTNGERLGTDIWTVGAGGAITALSDPEAEWEEMLLKLRSVLSAFDTDTFST
ncbi:para-aminobenzoate synthase [Serendipita vermifera]|nr:para-aminobenzoate synthase [Serendipita vermifera]